MSAFKESQVVYIFFKLLVYVVTFEIFSEEELFETKNSNKLKKLFSQTHLTILNIKSCVNKLSIKMFIKEFKVTYKKMFLTLHRQHCPL